MKRRILLFTFLLIYYTGFSQSELYVLVKLPVNNTGSDGAGDCDGRLGDYNSGYSYNYGTGGYVINNNSVYIKIDYQEGYNDDPDPYGCNGPCGQYSEVCSGIEYEKTFNHYDSYYNSYNGPDPIECGSDACFPINYHAVLLPKITSPVDRRCERQPLFSQYSDGVNHDVTGLVWEYYSTTGWKPIPSYQNRYPLNVSLLDIFGTGWRSQFNGNLQLRFKFTAPFTNDVIYSFSTYTIQLIECSPELVYDPPTLIPTLCNYSSDGSFTMIVNRDLITNEKMIVSLYKEDNTNPNGYSFLTQEETTILLNNNGAYSYTWQGGLLPDIPYLIKFQTLIGNGGIPETDPSWASLNVSNSFTIPTATKVEFKAKKLNDENCFKVNDGKMELFDVTGETGRTFEYQINNNSWISFTGNSTIINGLGKGVYKIRVRDSEKCVAR
ncbi:hypothetical protein P8625_02345 [Tenacibaculum tangerinum]|uniref:Uncharacterized protein n=1 Tax=Tenacibaculum tangerinum TaxID=3038772 RepID=A0ABY8L3L7_9FLAO|nr:hypothetical protein [Tenacibaculum tangerinum]WGH76029.1 hypothetical protein P8625_02345 [Tenacibaculum tangerinum]